MELELKLLRQDDGRAVLGESPCWDPAANCMWWVDIDGKKLLRTDLETQRTRAWQTPEYPGFVVLTAPERPAVGMQSGIFLFDPASGRFDRIVAFSGEGQRFNDATVDASGRLWTSTMGLDAAPNQGQIQLVSPELQLVPVVDGLRTPNGMAVDVEGDRFMFSDSHPDVQTIWSQPVRQDSSGADEREVFAHTNLLAGRPDGASLDENGMYWIAGVDGSALYLFNRKGQLSSEITMPFPAPTKVVFWGESKKSVAVTSKQIGENGGYLAVADLPDSFSAGTIQPYWAVGAA